MAETSLKKVQVEEDLKRRNQNERGRPSQQIRPRSQAFKGKQVQSSRSSVPPVCRFCGRNHFGRCSLEGVKCFHCQQEGHMARNCPQNRNQIQGRGTGRVYTLDAKKTKGDNSLIAGTCFVNGHSCFVLFDCGATHSFVSLQCMKRLGL